MKKSYKKRTVIRPMKGAKNRASSTPVVKRTILIFSGEKVIRRSQKRIERGKSGFLRRESIVSMFLQKKASDLLLNAFSCV